MSNPKNLLSQYWINAGMILGSEEQGHANWAQGCYFLANCERPVHVYPTDDGKFELRMDNTRKPENPNNLRVLSVYDNLNTACAAYMLMPEDFNDTD